MWDPSHTRLLQQMLVSRSGVVSGSVAEAGMLERERGQFRPPTPLPQEQLSMKTGNRKRGWKTGQPIGGTLSTKQTQTPEEEPKQMALCWMASPWNRKIHRKSIHPPLLPLRTTTGGWGSDLGPMLVGPGPTRLQSLGPAAVDPAPTRTDSGTRWSGTERLRS